MTHIILDTNILLRFPEVLSYKKTDTKLIIPDAVIEQILKPNTIRQKELLKLIEDAQNQESVYVSSTNSPQTKLSSSILVDFADFKIAGYAKYLVEQGNTDVIIATDDKKFIAFNLANNIKTIDSAGLIAVFKTTNSNSNQQILDDSKAYKKQVKASVFLNILYASFILFIIYLIYSYFGSIGDKITVPLLIAILIACSFGMFELRTKKPITYGLIEIGVGIMAIIAMFAPTFVLNQLTINMDFYIKIAAGLYIIVRGLDNLSKGTNEKGIVKIVKRLLAIEE
ncbi:MAG: PIN domain-containing protein [Flavobacterium sp.]